MFWWHKVVGCVDDLICSMHLICIRCIVCFVRILCINLRLLMNVPLEDFATSPLISSSSSPPSASSSSSFLFKEKFCRNYKAVEQFEQSERLWWKICESKAYVRFVLKNYVCKVCVVTIWETGSFAHPPMTDPRVPIEWRRAMRDLLQKTMEQWPGCLENSAIAHTTYSPHHLSWYFPKKSKFDKLYEPQLTLVFRWEKSIEVINLTYWPGIHTWNGMNLRCPSKSFRLSGNADSSPTYDHLLRFHGLPRSGNAPALPLSLLKPQCLQQSTNCFTISFYVNYKGTSGWRKNMRIFKRPPAILQQKTGSSTLTQQPHALVWLRHA